MNKKSRAQKKQPIKTMPETFGESSPEVPQEKSDQSIKTKKLITAGELFDLQNDDTVWLWNNLIPYRHLVMIAAPADVGKSILCRQLSYSVAMGKEEMLGRKLKPQTKRVIYVSTEENISDWSAKLKLLDLTEEEKESLSRNLLIAVDINDIFNTVKQEISKNPVDLVVLDVLMDLYFDDLNNPIKVRQFFAPFKKLAEEFNLAIVFIHHVSKAGEERGSNLKTHVLGSTSLVGGPRSGIIINRDRTDNSIRVINTVKGNMISDAEKNKIIRIKLNDQLLFELISEAKKDEKAADNTDQIRSEIAHLSTVEGLSVRLIAQKLNDKGINIGKTKVSEILKSITRETPVLYTTKNQIICKN